MAPDDRSIGRSGGSLRNFSRGESSRWRFNRSTTNLASGQPAQTQTKLERAPSKISLFNLFSKPKVERARYHPEVGMAVPMRPQTPPKTARSELSTGPYMSLGGNASPPGQQTVRTRSSQMFRPVSMRPTTPYKEPGSWEPPPLYQAFHQSTKHATVQACVFPPEVLMRTQSQRRQAELLREKIDITRDLSTIAENGSEAAKLDMSHKRLVSTSAPELVDKIYILIATGYVLQYDGDGSYDRLPEKVLKLGTDSAAFACDLIPGKHWVLQISSHAQDDGALGLGPKNSLLARLRSQSNNAKKPAISFLLVLESAEEMDSWMSAVRKEIDHHGGMKARDESDRASSSIDGSIEKTSTDTNSQHHLALPELNTVNVVTAVDPPLQPQSPSIVTPWETDRSERTVSVTDSSSSNSVGRASMRQSTDVSSIATTPVSPDQVQLDSLRERSRYSFMSTATSASGAGTRNTSRDSSPTPRSPLRDTFLPTGETEPLRSAMSLKSFHMNPTNGTASRRRSMQPLPVTDEHCSLSVDEPVLALPRSVLSLTPSTAEDAQTPDSGDLVSSPPQRAAPPPFHAAERLTAHIISSAREDLLPQRIKTEVENKVATGGVQVREDSPVRSNSRNQNVPSRYGAISPPPTGPLPVPPESNAQNPRNGPIPFLAAMAPISLSEDAATSRQRRLSATPKPFMRPFPIRPQARHIDTSNLSQRRRSAITPARAASPADMSGRRSVTSPALYTRPATNMAPTSHPTTLHSASAAQAPHALRRPASMQMQIRSEHSACLSRPVRAIASTPSFVPGKRASYTRNSRTPSPSASSALQSSLSIDAMRLQAQQQTVVPRINMPVNTLPPPAPPPNMPLPLPPPNVPLPPLPPISARGVAV
ncbi:hypothetical protein P153DRAFT_368242 [Dothidotthia symphoricarpi CBS 119687]|uniref:PH domain-containing protein n=1 Tax=Dothidotthia symphoricarpi CBS 119687 TaxID=1392245 RepID=A0A6A6A7Y3_9PLEO|nr:uncharacterized protein P153DRAFT_368242 [Dothidotthia symphoricarpi CBS 119687]KAF2127666.1 hypothetical protein P153DRAFT_368242 [Dothidotthia symphoricarpi CBS 119687]